MYVKVDKTSEHYTKLNKLVIEIQILYYIRKRGIRIVKFTEPVSRMVVAKDYEKG